MKRRTILKYALSTTIILAALFAAKAPTADEQIGGEINILSWGNYIDFALPGFEKKYGVKVNIDYYGDEQEAMNKIRAAGLGTHDVVSTPFQRQFPGIEVHATAADNLLRGDDVSPPVDDRAWILIATVLSGLAAAGLAAGLGYAWGAATVGVGIVAMWVAAVWLLSAGVFLSPLFPTIAAAATVAVIVADRYTQRARRADIETQPHTGKSIVDAPSGGQIGFESLRAALIGEDPLERERLWQKMYRFLGYYGRQGVGMHMLSGVDIALWDIAGKAFGQPVCKLLGAKYRDRVKAYASTLFRPTPDELAALFPGQSILEKKDLVGDTYWMHVRKRPVTLFFRHFFRFFVPFFGWKKWKRSMGKLYWLFNNYRVAAIAGRKLAEAPAATRETATADAA